MIFLFVLELPAVIVFYSFYSGLNLTSAVCASINFILISGIWLVSLFITALKNYKTVIQAFLLGTLSTIGASAILAGKYGASGIINSFSFGLSVIMALLVTRILIEYPYAFKSPFRFVRYFRKYWEIALAGLIYNTGIWVDKWIMWFAPEADSSFGNMPLYPDYDGAMFLAYLTVVPAMSYFVFAVETNFFEYYVEFYRDIQSSATLQRIKSNHKKIIGCIIRNSRSLLVLQGTVCLVTLLMAPKIFDFISVSFLQLSMFRFGVLGSLFQVFFLFLTILLSYFDNRKATLQIQTVFFLTNLIFSFLALKMGFKYYGLGFFLASSVTFAYAFFITMRYVNKLIFHTFITANKSVSQ